MNLPEQQLYIDGDYVSASSGIVFPSFNPATGEEICKVQLASSSDLDRAVVSARRGFEQWSGISGTERSRILLRAVALLRDRNDELAKLEVMDTGKPIAEAQSVDVMSGADCIEYFAHVAPTIRGHQMDLPGALGYTRREPLGVCAGIGAWNYPIQIACWKAAMALACGNALIYKPSELTPLSCLKLAEILTEAGVPAGVFNVVLGDSNIGSAMSLHPGIDKVSLTGSTATGKKVMAAAASTLKHVSMELGGKSPLVIFEDADLDNAVSAAMMANFYTQGEICTNGTRVFVHTDIHDEFVARLLTRTRNLTIGDPMNPETQIGSLISPEHMQKVLAYIEQAKSDGATLLCGGKKSADPALAAGAFVEPTIFTGCADDMRTVQDEVFGPVMSILTFSEEDEVIARANNTPYGLAAGVFTQNLARAHRVIAQLQAGTCWINNYNITPIEMPIGGYKQSGLGRENGPTAIEHYTQLKSVYVELGDVDCPY
ncbi:betaine-aldehyde dehydrogenase [Congregibacter variabilis]|uniref:Betaine-aldehyde dehydrogenase n=1 Tax=Congregibacter variabilis TaxID=3081200 RepID=A0ABZ0I5R5_9GAMM|nr:betaine-aldehyde dehydrogenase [Congregibacter sp. IMCC43200]